MVGARVIVVENGMDRNCKHKGLRGIVSAVSKECFYISHETMVIAARHPSSSIQSLDDTVDGSVAMVTDLSAACITSEESSCREPVVLEVNPPEPKKEQPKKEVEWVRAVVVRRILRSTSVLALLLPPPPTPCKATRIAMDGEVSGDCDGTAHEEKGRICLLHGSKQMPFTTHTL
jgi:hypothetical protein